MIAETTLFFYRSLSSIGTQEKSQMKKKYCFSLKVIFFVQGMNQSVPIVFLKVLKGERKTFFECYFIVVSNNIHLNKNYFIHPWLSKLF